MKQYKGFLMNDSEKLRLVLQDMSCNDAQFDLMLKYVLLLREWNEKINLISRADVDQLIDKHIAESVEFARLSIIQSAQKLLDVGTGGGLPGIPLAILFPACQFVLLDSRQKKTVFLHTAVKALSLSNVKIVCGRVEDQKTEFVYDVITARAVAAFDKLWNWTKHLLSDGGVLIAPKGCAELPAIQALNLNVQLELIDYAVLKNLDKVFVVAKKN